VSRSVACAATALTLAAPQAARAHGSAALGEFWGGVLQPAFHPESLLLLLGVGLWVAQLREPTRWRLAIPFVVAAVGGGALGLAGAALPGFAWIVRGGALAAGLFVAAQRALPAAFLVGLAVLLGLGQGYAATFADRADLARPLLYLAGVGLAPLVVCGQLVMVADRFRAFWVGVAFRIAGSWIATIALLVASLELARPSA
jgi:urease accessory protein